MRQCHPQKGPDALGLIMGRGAIISASLVRGNAAGERKFRSVCASLGMGGNPIRPTQEDSR